MLEIKGLSKKYGDTTALSGVELCVEGKGIFGILGDRGAGKTALARIMSGCENADEGEVRLGGELVCREALAQKCKIRLVPSALEMYAVTTPTEYLDFVGDSLGVAADKKYRQIKEALELCCLDDAQNKPFSSLSKAQRSRLALAAALIGNPEVIVIDTAFDGIDSKSVSQIYEILTMLGKIKTVVLFSKKPAEVKSLCESVAILCDGRVVVSGRIDEIEKKLNSTRQMYITVRGDKERVFEAIRSVDTVIDVRLDKSEANNVSVFSVEHRADDRIKDKIFGALAAINSPMLSVRSVTLSLDDVFYSFSSSKKGETQEGGKGR